MMFYKKIFLLTVTLFLVQALEVGNFASAEARTDLRVQASKVSKNKNKNKNKKKHSRKYSIKKRRKKGTGPDLRELTMGSPYTENPDNGINPVETKEGL